MLSKNIQCNKNITKVSIYLSNYSLLVGHKISSVLGKTYFSFQGIPYAKPPVGDLRFKPPQPLEYLNVVNTKTEPKAPHFDMVSKQFCGDEDCLYLNVYTPQIPENENFNYKAVMVWFHGGGYAFGHANADIYGPDLLIEQDVVLVTVNYRLGVLGFLNLDIDGASGNMGLKDQVAALRWVKQEIKAFGGDPNNVTIFGNSAGGACVHLHMLSDMSKGLYHKVIAESGNALCNWAFTTKHKERAFQLGKLLGFETNDEQELLKFFHTVPPLQFSLHQDSIMTDEDHLRGVDQAFVPSIEILCDQPFITEHPHHLLRKGKFNKVPFITGITAHEGINVIFSIKKYPWIIDRVNSDFKLLLPGEESTVRELQKFYFDNDTVSEDHPRLIDLFTDINFLVPIYESIMLQLKYNQPIYFYEFSHDGLFGWYKQLMSKHRKIEENFTPTGVCHCDELGYLFSNNVLNLQNLQAPSQEKEVSANITELWCNFAKTSIPSTTGGIDFWNPILNDENFTCLNISKNLTVDCKQLKARMGKWKKLELSTAADY